MLSYSVSVYFCILKVLHLKEVNRDTKEIITNQSNNS